MDFTVTMEVETREGDVMKQGFDYNIGDSVTKVVNSVELAFRNGVKIVLDPTSGECYFILL